MRYSHGESYKLHCDRTKELGLLSQGGLKKQGFIAGVRVVGKGREIIYHVENIVGMQGTMLGLPCKPD